MQYAWDPSSEIRDQIQASLHWKHGILTTGPPRKSLQMDLNENFHFNFHPIEI